MESKRKITSFFWALFFLGILLQLATSESLPFSAALLYTLSVLATFRLYFHYASRPATQRFIGRLPTLGLLLLLLILCGTLTLVLAAQGYIWAKALLPTAVAQELFHDSLPNIFGLFIISGFVCCLHYLFEKYKESFTREKELEMLKRQALEMEMHLLRNQLSPHFTFNVLNNLHFLIHKDKNEALQLLATYSKLLRYYAYESRKKTIALRQEVAFLQAYFELQLKQREADLQVVFDATPADDTFCISPFLLATFVENAFKHVLPNTAGKYYVRHSQSLTPDGQLTFELRNTCREASPLGEYNGLGLKHVQESLALAYPGCHRLDLRQEDGLFCVQLEVKLSPC
ncbi:sensor histidine kinase [Hymenobacter cellulosilyticus]|uniref:Histidine kinase n=1 Tax=Hymenobacter cellulosilyticus TaxID=2932248 RepID=A0A8T9Q2D4_9BACT|nr:histidine kinase [Hymenobacter cellulosilyticus]UOQ71597.1 histidine kinase [Hymenobacter cellulosilyticus]